MTLPMAIADYIPVILFLIASMTLLHDLYHAMSKGAFALFSAGVILIFTAGLFKATWKLLYALNICDFVALNNAFFPMQSTGFVLGALGIIGFLFFKQNKAFAVVPPVYTSSLIFVIFTIFGTFCMWMGLAWISSKMKEKKAALLFILSFICMLGMGYLSSKDFANPLMNWIGEIINNIGMILLFIGVRILHKGGLEFYEK
ncbi:MAG: hypothetical protein IKR11_04320 [Solobacterium sp.]|nr:hypothetical protein [Solobacterium sp.]